MAALPSAAAGPGEPRIQTLEYAGGGVTAGPDRTVALRAGTGIGAVEFRGGPERFVSVEIEDAHGLPVAAVVAQPGEDGTHVCGSSRKPLRIRPFENVTVYLMSGVCGAGTSVATTGAVTATFTRR